MTTLAAYEARHYPAGQAFETPADRYAVRLSDGSHLELPLRVLPTGDKAIALLMTNQCDFAVEDALAPLMAQAAQEFAPDVIAAVPTMGLDYGRLVARGLGHPHYVALGHSRKFWYDEALSESTTSSTSTKGKQVYLDPALVERIKGKRVVLVDDVVASGGSLSGALALLRQAGADVVAIGTILTEAHDWRERLGVDAALVQGLAHIPQFTRTGEDAPWTPIAQSL